MATTVNEGAVRRDFRLSAGDFLSLTVTVRESDGELKDLTGFGSNFQAWRAATLEIDVDEDDGGVLVGDDEGTLTVEFTVPSTAGRLRYLWTMTNLEGHQISLYTGTLIIR